jgi:hypothetical protein
MQTALEKQHEANFVPDYLSWTLGLRYGLRVAAF